MVRLYIPGEPQGKARHRTTNTGHTYTPQKTQQYEELVRWVYRRKCGDQLQWGGKIPLSMRIVARYKIPKSASKRTRCAMLAGEITPTKKPDADNVLKVIADSLNKLCYRDDAQIVRAEIVKCYAEQPGVDVMIWENEGEEAFLLGNPSRRYRHD